MNRRRFARELTATSLVAAGTSGVALRPSAAPAAGAREYYTGDFVLSLQSYSFKKKLDAWLMGEPGEMSTLDLIDWAAGQQVDGIDIPAYFIPGYSDTEIPGNRAAIEAYAGRVKNRCATLHLALTGTGVKNDFANTDRAKRELDVQRSKYWIEIAAQMGAPVMRVFAGPVPPGYERKWHETAAWMADCCRRVAEHGHRFGVKVAVQNHGDSLATAQQALTLVSLVDNADFGIVDDTGYFRAPNAHASTGYDWYADIAAVLPGATSVVVKSKPAGRESSVAMDLPRLFRLIRASPYRGPLGVEYLVSRAELPSYDPAVRVPAFLKTVRDALELSKEERKAG